MSLWLDLWHATLWESSAYGPWGPIWDNPFDVVVGDVGSLRALYEATDGDHWTDNTNWLTGGVLGDWFGIVVNSIFVERIQLASNNLNGTLTGWSAPGHLSYQGLRFNNNPSLQGDITTWVFPDTLEHLWLYNTGVSGDISGISWPPGLVDLLLNDTSVSGDITGFTFWSDLDKFNVEDTGVTGSVSGWSLNAGLKSLNIIDTAMTGTVPANPSTLTILYVSRSGVTVDFSTLTFGSAFLRLAAEGCTLTGTLDLSGATKLDIFNVKDCGLNQAEVDAIIDEIYANRAIFTDAGPTLNINGTNSAPSGSYAYSATPSTGKEKVYALINDDDAEGFNTWTITYTV